MKKGRKGQREGEVKPPNENSVYFQSCDATPLLFIYREGHKKTDLFKR